MSQDQHTIQDPTEQHPDSLPADQLDHPGIEGEMSHAPDFGEQSYRGTGKLEGRKAIVTGGDSGIGRAVALAFAREGADVAISYLGAEQRDADETTRVVREAGRTALQLPGDLQDSGYCRMLVERSVRELGGVDILVNNAGRFLPKGILDTTDDEWDALMRTNVGGTFVHCRAALPTLLERRGAIVNVASVSGMVGSPGQAAYCATKGAVVQLTRQLAVEFAPRGVRVNAVGPGAIDTEFVARSLGLEPGDRPIPPAVLESHPLGRVATPGEIAGVIAFLASPLSGFMTGSIVMADGGATAR
jgi:NAD(P)-dependent dehydrogenase (short-subunit alcohol dehydrogenase family)